MDFGALPPEVNSGRMYYGPGCGSMLAASAAWDGLAADLHSVAGSYGTVIADLTRAVWRGPASVAMAAAAAPYVWWLTTTAGLCEQAATGARAAAAAYEAAFAMTVPPPVVAANRAQLMLLIATNILGQNTAAIAATEAEYGEMWAQDAGAMFAYAGLSAAASALPPFTSPAPTSNPAGTAGQEAAAAHAGATSAGTATQTLMSTGSRLLSAVPNALEGLAVSLPAAAALPSSSELLGLLSPVNLGVSSAATAITSTGMAGSYAGLGYAAHYDPDGASKMDAILERLGALPEGSGAGAVTSLGAANMAAGGAAPALPARLGRASSIGALSVPPSWVAATPTIRAVTVTWPNALPDAVPAVLATNPENLLNEMLLASMVMRGIRGVPSQARPTITITVTPHPPDTDGG
ncbi:PPE family protein [Mycobacterium intracellulare]|uniref:PPE family protein n=1 Tax=Mycobacterium intracellulare TaxID=1767 RepID=A0AAE4RDG1_MYCIT|nr:PPE family protein [Mycobacterium intracellulare]MCA2322556.1 PPE family protein [Mycobacterium intracellulare]MCA2343125.1 PPE family protein [Mycobacterium intracellulare]MDV6978034.1 PPE family protein [Mycobacterium intracellulare]MDV6983448.1 PPE family protein [Mycobacterium intracellulare]MDV7012188.1 PPE family protein [Mycobacterium intracellulare]